MSDARSVVVIGDALIDEFRNGTDVERFAGGAALNVAVGLGVLGIRSTLIGMVGADVDGELVREHLRSFDVGFLATIGDRGTSVAVSDRTNGEPVYVFNDAARHRRIEFDGAQREAIAAADFIVVTCFPFDDEEQACRLADSIRHSRGRVIIDPNPRSGMLHDRSAFVRGFEQLAGLSLLTKLGEEDAALLYGQALSPVRDHLLHVGAAVVLATRGANGADVSTATGVQARADIAVLPGPIVDTMGAGDACLAAFVAALASGSEVPPIQWGRILDEAMLIAATTCRHEGALLRLPEPV
ncbi:PfkB family carbohydrate kinase [Glaciibacter superstes]|uniref:PfkB family carbohydrate kinase n=1 Tax=Glaciibacter superstes TaxID=501023 RepID=UPI0003B3C2C7|nr:PfkB family carbohydrate kinase [Glaciibacter superstes]